MVERQKEDLRASRKLGFISKPSLAITILSQIKSIKDDGRFNMETALVGGFTAAVSPPLQIVFLDSASLASFKREEVELISFTLAP